MEGLINGIADGRHTDGEPILGKIYTLGVAKAIEDQETVRYLLCLGDDNMGIAFTISNKFRYKNLRTSEILTRGTIRDSNSKKGDKILVLKPQKKKNFSLARIFESFLSKCRTKGN